jgi:uncharacterized protein (DUF952 family)
LQRFEMTLIFKILGNDEWRLAETAGVFEGSAVDRSDGYIHFSTAEQAPETAAKYFSGRSDLLLIAVDAQLLGEALKWEPSRGGALFPHLYASLPIERACWVRALPLGPDGKHIFGSLDS